MENISSNDGYNILQERGLDHLYIYPQYMLYGAGEGNYARFELVSHECEIHSTLPAILFYYGIVPFLLIACWIYKRTYKLNKHYMPVYLAIIFESFTLLNYRQSLFWVVFVFSEFIIEKGEKNEN
ncbi:MAG: hypothetical protein IKO78_03575 [Bacilli bacterium]|nr:hypothetical protein [Bacilli bacterium]